MKRATWLQQFWFLVCWFLLCWCCLLGGAPAHAQRFHALIVADASPAAGWGKFAPHVHFDVTYMLSMLLDNVPPDRLEFRILSIEQDADARPQAVLQMLDELQPAAEDTLLVYYTGHGGSDDRGQYFDLVGGKLYRNDLRATMNAKGARLAALLTDCCNVRSDGEKIAAAAPGPDEPQDYTPVFRSLFIEPAGSVDINACSPGESAFFIPEAANEFDQEFGSLFTKALSNYVRNNRDQQVSWEDLLLNTSLQVNVWFRAGYPKGATMAKGNIRQLDQNVFAIEYPGMPEASGQRAGVMVKNRQGRAVIITEVRDGYPAAQAYDVAANQYTSLRAGQEITVANGRRVKTVDEFLALMKESPQVMRLTVRTSNGEREFLMRLRY
ncbi:MAG: caspase family protein [Planctomycetia bacterium]|nr:caspase family protein [Planctomycetia bacterium]